MNKDEAELLLIRASSVDQRKVNPLMIDAWHDVLADVDYVAGLEALRVHRQTAPGVYLEPGHIFQLAQRGQVDALEAEQQAAKVEWLAGAGLTLTDFDHAVTASDITAAVNAVQAIRAERGLEA